MARSRSNERQAIVDMAAALRSVFKDYIRDTRRRAWRKLTTGQGKKDVEKLLNQPSIPLSRFRKLVFADWLTLQEKNRV